MAAEYQHVFGIHAVEALLREHPSTVENLWLKEGALNRRLAPLAETARAVGVPVRRAPPEDLERMAGVPRHQGAVARVWQRELAGEKPLLEYLAKVQKERTPLLLVLEGLDDPRNLGACLRSAEG
ncbi:MAG: 23S rRNA (guanosine(2251)-2'-O)-methyltransferase RlmB, partial [Gammaproteobacteria bacterium]|nr:23S rRNA (guanosine(2251)-2'-O)-methyltransferase RlmB [Gammaproteobacteria bacterium]